MSATLSPKTKIKICGITRLSDAIYAAELGVDMLGFNFYPQSKRFIQPDLAEEICRDLRAELGDDCPDLVGLFVNAGFGEISAIKNGVGLDFVQLSEDENAQLLNLLHNIAFKAIRPATVKQAAEQVKEFIYATPLNDHVPSLLLDAYQSGQFGGTGYQTSDAIALEVKKHVPRLMLAGGLTPENVAERCRVIRPWGVDVASGVENDTPGIKDQTKVKQFIAAVQDADANPDTDSHHT
jgi:phosphoribosylanthranilate isomerase